MGKIKHILWKFGRQEENQLIELLYLMEGIPTSCMKTNAQENVNKFKLNCRSLKY